jgi:hypothetical protein
MSSFWEWLIGEAGAGWIIGVLGITGGLYTWYNRIRPPKVVIHELRRTRLLDIAPSRRENLHISYTDESGIGHTVKYLEQTEFAVYNTGTVDINEGIELSILYKSDAQIKQQDPMTEKKTAPLFIDKILFSQDGCSSIPILGADGSIREGDHVFLPYLNSYVNHQHYVIAYSIAGGTLNFRLGKSVGKGWSAQLITLEAYNERRATVRNLIRYMALIIFVITYFILTGPILQRSIYATLGADSLLWPFNLTEDSIERRVNRFADDYQRQIDELKEMAAEMENELADEVNHYHMHLRGAAQQNLISRFFALYFTFPRFSELLGISLLLLVMLVIQRIDKIADYLTCQSLGTQNISRFIERPN